MTPRTAMFVALGAVLIVGMWAAYRPSQPEPIIPADHQFVTMCDFATLANHRAEEFASKQLITESPPHSVLNAQRPLRLGMGRIQVEYGGTTSHGTGVLVRDGRYMLTAAHVVHAVNEHPDATISVYFRDHLDTKGTSNLLVPARVVKSAYEPANPEVDWCVLEILESVGAAPSVPIGKPVPNELAYHYGYPTEMGVDRHGQVQYWTINDHFDVVLMVCRVPADGSWEHEPVAGGRSLGGMSGGPVLNANGELIAVHTGWRKTLVDGEATHTTRVSHIDDARAFLDKQ